MTAYEEGVGLACKLTGCLTTTVLEGLTPLERMSLADELYRNSFPGLLERWNKLSTGEQRWLLMCDRLHDIAATVGAVDSGLQWELGTALSQLGGFLQCTPDDERALGVEDAGFARLEDEAFGF